MSEDIGLHARMTADSGNTAAVMNQLYENLIDLEQETRLLKKAQKELEKELDKATEKYGYNSKEVANLKGALIDNAKSQRELQKEVLQANAAIDKQTKEYAKNAKQAENVVSGTERIKNGINMIKAAILGYAGKTLFDALIGDNAKFEQYITSFEVMLGSYEKANKMMDDLNDFAAKTPLELGDVTKSTQLLLNYGVAQDEIITKLQQLGDVSQGSAEKMNRVALAYGQMVAKQKVTGEELRQMTEAGVPLTQALADALGVTTAQLSKMIEKGEVGIPALNKALEQLTDEGGKFFGMMDKQSQTAMGLFSTLKDNISMFARDVGEESFEYLKSELQDLMNTISAMKESGELDAIAEGLGSSIANAIKFIGKLVEILYEWRKAILVVGGAWLGLKAGLAIESIISGLISGWKSLTATLVSAKGAMTGAKVENETLKASLATTPWGAVAAIIGVVAGALISYNAAADAANDKTISIGEHASETSSELLKLYSQYEALDNISDRTTEQEKKFKSIQEQLISKLGEKGEALKKLTQDTDTYREALEKATRAEIESQRATVTAGAKASKEKLESGTRTWLGTQKVFNSQDPYTSLISETMGKYHNEGSSAFVIPKEASQILQFYSDLKQAQIDLTNEYQRLKNAGQDAQAEALIQSQTYSEVTRVLNELTENVDKYAEAKTQEALLNEIWANGIPKTTEEYEQMKKAVFEATGANEDFRQKINQIVASNFPQFATSADLAADSLNSMSDSTENASGKMEGLAKELDSMVDKYQTVKNAQDEFKKSGNLTASTLSDIIEKYPEMEDAVSQYIAGLIDEKTLLSQLSDHYKTDEENYKNTVLSKIQNSEEFARILHNSCADKINELGKLYNIDLSNFKSLADAKAKIETELLGSMINAWKTYYNATTGELDQEYMNALEVSNPGGAKALYRAQAAMNALNSISLSQITVKSPSSAVSSSGSKKSSGSKNNSAEKAAKEAEQARKEQVKAYENAVSEMMRIDERWNDRRKLREEISDKDYLWNLGNRADTYRKYADEVLTLDYMTDEEKANLRKQYLEKAEDFDDEYLKFYQSMQEAEKQAALESLNERKEASEEWIEQQRKQGNYDEVIAGIERVKAYMKEYYELGILSAKEYNKAVKELDTDIYDAKRDKFEAWLRDAEKYKDDRDFYNDWGKHGDSPEKYFARKRAEIEAAKASGLFDDDWEYYTDLIRALDREEYSYKMERFDEEEKRLKEKYQKQMEYEKKAVEEALKLKKKQFQKELDYLDELQRKRKEQKEDDDDNLKMERLKNKLEYEVDGDNRKALQKEIDKLQESIDDKMFNRDIEARKEKIKKAQEYETEAAQKKIDRITKYYERKMSSINLANEISKSIDLEEFETMGEKIGGSIAEGLQKQLDGTMQEWKKFLRETVNPVTHTNFGGGSAVSTPSKRTTITINQKNYGVSTPYQQNIGIKKIAKDLEMGVF